MFPIINKTTGSGGNKVVESKEKNKSVRTRGRSNHDICLNENLNITSHTCSCKFGQLWKSSDS